MKKLSEFLKSGPQVEVNAYVFWGLVVMAFLHFITSIVELTT